MVVAGSVRPADIRRSDVLFFFFSTRIMEMIAEQRSESFLQPCPSFLYPVHCTGDPTNNVFTSLYVSTGPFMQINIPP